ncbi:SpoIIE family protein phosphatase [Streptomyces sp. ventii]|uniref:SpoIIE family protein phosphatase n=1 Tax=Streptomyces spiramenti TaxID=2720606 RepID=A0ABX1ANJ5_9ACTN|nr:SpoIIE family protein phosphatase [Streptomyces spiramenti]
MQFALHHAVAAVGGLGGVVHLTGPWEGSEPRLVVVDGLPEAEARGFHERIVGRAGPRPGDGKTDGKHSAPEGGGWVPAPEAAHGGVADHAEVAGVLVVPLATPRRVLGTLSVICLRPPEPAEREPLTEIASVVSERLGRSLSADHVASPPAWPARAHTSPLSEAVRSVSVGSWDWNIRTGELRYDVQATRVLGMEPHETVVRIGSWVDLVHPDDLPWVMADTEEAIRTRSLYGVEYRIRRPDGTTGWVQSRGRVIPGDDGRPGHLVGTVWDTTRTRVARDAVDDALRHMTDGFLAVDSEWRIMFVNAEADRALGPVPATGDRLLWDLPAGRAPGFEDACRRAVAENTPAGVDLRPSADGRWYHLRLVPVPQGLTVYSTDITEARRRDAERERAARESAEQSAHIARLTGALAEAITKEDVVRATAEHVLRPFGAARMAIITLAGGSAGVVGSLGYSAGEPAALWAQGEGASPLTDTAGSRVPLFLGSPAEYRRRYPRSAGTMTGVGDRSWAFLPLVVSGRVTGCCLLAFPVQDAPRSADRSVLAALCGLIAQALERARLYDAEHERAQELQRGLLPQHLPTVPAVDTAACYLPADRRLDIGGDWYDVIPLSAERAALVIGDVMGHGLSEAATMGRLRTAVRTLSELELPPDEILTHLNDLVSELGDDFYATCLYAVYDPTSRMCDFASAGHLPPVVVRPDGTAHVPRVPANAPLGAATPPFDVLRAEVPDGSLLALFTDGLVEARGHDIDDSVDRFTRLLAASARRDDRDDAPTAEDGGLDALCDALVTSLTATLRNRRDDAALLLARTHALTSENVAVWPLSAEATAASRAREMIRGQLTRWGLEDLVMTTELVVSELVANVVRHAQEPVTLRLLRGRSLVCEVSDGSLTTPHVRRAADTDEGGRGLQLVSALTHRWGARYSVAGKTIWTEQPLPEDQAP